MSRGAYNRDFTVCFMVLNGLLKTYNTLPQQIVALNTVRVQCCVKRRR